jgi:hypothetical protein
MIEEEIGQTKIPMKSDKCEMLPIMPFYNPYGPNDKTLIFESRFESGNLAMAVKHSLHEYNLILQNDINTTGHTQCIFKC